jgi:hypothetical protein
MDHPDPHLTAADDGGAPALPADPATRDRDAAAGDRPVHHRLVHQATGMIAVQVGVSPSEALMRLRTAAGAARRSLDDVAADVVAGEVRFHRRDRR